MTTGPTTRRRQLGATMRKLRERKGMTLEEAGKLVGVSKATVSRYETKEGPVKWPIVDALCREYDATETERQAVVTWAKSAREQGWWGSLPGALPETLNLLLTLEDEAVREDHFSTVYVPGLLQTRGYAEAVLHASEMRQSAEDVERQVTIRLKRQEIFHRPHPPHIWAVLDESVVRRVVGGPSVMRGQLDHLLSSAETPNVTLQILPFATGAHASAMGSFVVLGGAEPSLDVVYLDIHTGAVFMEKEEELDIYRRAFDYLRAQALGPAESVEMIRRAREEMQ
ncbi:helix-turn-helix domain-containing protein [Streptomyces sp.]|uniref:helix-turn-helix domain-containing protein n=1 Tax=Streptomyces sp. TaxID=1931 RepID=UPI002F42F5B0